MKKLLILLTAAMLVMGFAGYASADGYYEFSSFHWSDTEFRGGSDCGSYGNQIFVHNGTTTSNSREIDVYIVSVSDISLRDQTPFLEGSDGIYGTVDDVANPAYQARTLTYERTITLGSAETINYIHQAEIHVDASGLYITGGSGNNDVLHFDLSGAYLGKAVDASSYTPTASMLGYDAVNSTWYMANENRAVYSSTGGEWTSEFTFSAMAGGHGDGIEFVTAPDGTGFLYVSDMTSNFIGQWAEGDNPDTASIETGWNEWNRFDYAELMGGTAKYVEGMGFGALGHFWVTSAYWTGESGAAYLYELGGGDIGGYTPPPPSVPEPSTIFLLGVGLAGLVGYSRKKKLFRK